MNTRRFVSLAAATAVLSAWTASGQVLSFSEHQDFTLGDGRITGMALGDLNSDGETDAVFVDSTANQIIVMLGKEGARFSTPARVALPSSASHLALGDFNDDGIPDVVTSAGGITVLLGRGDGQFAPPLTSRGSASQVVVADFNGDGRDDIASVGKNHQSIIPETVDVYLGNGDGTFGPFRTLWALDYHPRGLNVVHLDADNLPDLAFGISDTRQLLLYVNNGDGTFRPSANAFMEVGPADTAIGDIDRDGPNDLVLANFRPSASLFSGNGDGTVQAGRSFAVSSCVGDTCPAPQSVALADVNNDGWLDLVAAISSPGGLSVLLNDRTGGLLAPVVRSLRQHAFLLAVADFNRDGLTDAAVVNSDVGSFEDGERFLSVFLNTSASGAMEPVSWGTVTQAELTGSQLQKTSGCDGCYDALGTSMQQIDRSGGVVQFTVVDPTRLLIAGLGDGTTPRDVEFGVFLTGHGFAEVREKDRYKADTRIEAGDVLSIWVDGGRRVHFARNGVEFYASRRPVTRPLHFVVLLASIGAAVADVQISSAD
jgi:hypothetical protein